MVDSGFRPDPDRDISHLAQMLGERHPFRFVRFSDGECVILRGQRLEIGETYIVSASKRTPHNLPRFDRKLFDPNLHDRFRKDLIESARHRGPQYFIGLPGSHNKGLSDDREQILEWHGGLDQQCTFADLLINSNYRRFIAKIVPKFATFDSVFVVGNHRMDATKMHPAWRLISVPDDLIDTYPESGATVWNQILQIPKFSLVLCSASSLTNILGCRVDKERQDLTFIDIGTALHPFMGMGSGTRDYHVQLARPWGLDALRKVRYRLSGHYQINW